MVDDDLLELGVVCHVPILVNTSGFIAGSSHQPPSACYQHKFESVRNSYVVDVTLDDGHAPIVRDVLGDEVFAKVVVPHVAAVNTLGEGIVSFFFDFSSSFLRI